MGERIGIELPSVALRPNDLRELESRLLNVIDEPKIEIAVESDGFVDTYHSMSSLLSDEMAPQCVTSFRLSFEGVEGEGKLIGNCDKEDYHHLILEGEFDWVKRVKIEIQGFMKERKNRVRTYLSGHGLLAPLTIIFSVITGHYFLLIAPLGVFHPAEWRIPTPYLRFLIFMTVLVSLAYRYRLFPYAQWEVIEGEGVYFWVSALKALGLALFAVIFLFTYSTAGA
jgi:hypothetical protein